MRYRVGAGTGWPGVSILWLAELASFICNFRLVVGVRKSVVSADHGITYRLVGFVVKAPASCVEDSRYLHGDLSGSSHTSDLQICSPVAALPGAWRYKVSAGTAWPGVSIL